MAEASPSSDSKAIIALDVGDKRIGVAHAETSTRIAVALTTVEVDGLEFERLREIIAELEPAIMVVGFPRNQSGSPTKQTEKTKAFAKQLERFGVEIVFQDESLTSVLAEKYLKSLNKPYSKADIDSHAAAIILGDYLEINFGA
ncbi:Holliday junction resolvase RuvX [Candidatus Saccharibacteria bacterium]|nr:Holliday junction resolvase RuvX [Candidatus Saccharibacteria bacterium]